MSIKAILFDLDGTLLPMDQDLFIKAYMGGLVKTAAAAGYAPETMMKAIFAGTTAMVKNTGVVTNEQVFWETVATFVGDRVLSERHMFDEFYRTDFEKVRDVCGYEPRAAEVIGCVKREGFRVALATNPLFPSVATASRIGWAGLSVSDFEFFTSFETSHYCKPNPDYYREVLSQMALSPEECVMVGNDVDEDMIAERLSMQVFLLTDCMINRKNRDISVYPHGGVDELIQFIKTVK